jgi:soluble lytic murein transglycosylase-like protein
MDQRNRDAEGIDRPSAEDRRRADRRHSPVGAVRPGQVERRRSSRRHIAGAGLLAALAFGGVRYQQHRMLDPMTDPMEDAASDLGTPEELLDDSAAVDEEDVDPREALEPIIQEAAALHGVDPDLVKAVIQTESRFDARAASGAGAKGLMQLMPNTAKAVGIEDPFDARQNIFGGVKYLSQMMERYNGNTALALAAYNAGPGNVRRHRGVPPFRETRGYVTKIAKLLADSDSDAAFSVPVYRAPAKKARVSSRSARRAGVKKASMTSRAKTRKATVTRAKTPTRKKATATRASARRTSSRRASRT